MSKGGKRANAGRPSLPAGEKKRLISLALHPRLIAWMDDHDQNRSKIIETAITAHFGLCPDCCRPNHKFHNCETSPVSEPGKPEGEKL